MLGAMAIENWVVGPEHDEALFQRLGNALRARDYSLDPEAFSLAGSQTLSQWRAVGPDGTLTIEAETYVGLSVSGSQEGVAQLQHAFADVASNNSVK